MNKDRLKKLDDLFNVLSIVADGTYVYLCDVKEDYSHWSKKAVDYFQLPDEYMYNAGRIWEEHIHPDDREGYSQSIENIFSGKESCHDMQYRARARDGSYVACTCRGTVIYDENGNPDYFCGAIRNHGIISYIDNITGLRSLYGFFEDLKGTFGKSEEAFVIIIGVSGFSDLNDVYGYRFGNRILQKLGRVIQSRFLNCGAVYRMDGIKFAVISHELNFSTANVIYEELQQYLTKEFYVDGERVNISINGGAVVADTFDIGIETFYSCLKYAYYESKHHKLGELVLFDNKLSDDNRRMIEKLNVIRNSIAEDCKGFYLCYQPIVNSETEELKGMEALIRWKNEEYGSVPPVQFIPVLEQDTLFPELGKWILRQAMTDGRFLVEKYPNFIMNVNLSYAQLEKSDFVADVINLLEETGFPPQNLCLEITERCRLLDMSLLQSMFEIFKEKGIKVALDDFGTGFSSLGVLRVLPIDTVKIDREFVKNIERSHSDQYTVQFISDLAKAFEAEVCVEGVETAEMRDFLKSYNVSSFQGYYYSKPIPIDEFYKNMVK